MRYVQYITIIVQLFVGVADLLPATPNTTPEAFEEILFAAKDAKVAKKVKGFWPRMTRIYTDIMNDALMQYLWSMFF